PNPVRDRVQIRSEWDNPLHYELRDALGRLILQGNFKEQKTLPLEKLNPGIYLLRIRDQNKYQYIRRLKKQ
ncbi:MAG: T9SS type A sorting domain-containing protein, partial [Bacteroidota bacterium]